ncbi:MAG: DUF4058 family protein, partial [Fimbriiglobus sp.]
NSGVLPAGYYAMAEQVTGPGNPDVLTLESPNPFMVGNGHVGGISVALADAIPRSRIHDTTPKEYAVRARRIAVRRTNGDDVVAVIEVVSPGNKSSRSGFRSFVSKAVDFLDAGIHLLVLDLFPPTARDPQGIHPVILGEMGGRASEFPADKSLTLASYLAAAWTEAFVEPVAVGDVLPDMPLFLTPEMYVNVPLESTYLAAWDDVPRRWQSVIAPPAGG